MGSNSKYHHDVCGPNKRVYRKRELAGLVDYRDTDLVLLFNSGHHIEQRNGAGGFEVFQREKYAPVPAVSYTYGDIRHCIYSNADNGFQATLGARSNLAGSGGCRTVLVHYLRIARLARAGGNCCFIDNVL